MLQVMAVIGYFALIAVVFVVNAWIIKSDYPEVWAKIKKDWWLWVINLSVSTSFANGILEVLKKLTS